MRALLIAGIATVIAASASAAPVTFGSTTVDTTTGPTAINTANAGRSGNFSANASPVFATAGVTTLGQLDGGAAGNALFIGERFPTDPTWAFNAARVGVTLGAPVFNNPGADLAVFVSGGLPQPSTSGGGSHETISFSTAETGAYWYQTYSEFTQAGSNTATTINGFFTYLIDLTDLGVAPGGSISELWIANFSPWATVTGGAGDGSSGVVDPSGMAGVSPVGGFGTRFFPHDTDNTCAAGSFGFPTGTSPNSFCFAGLFNGNAFVGFDTDPDILYVAGLQGSATPVPVPAALTLFGLALAGLAALRRRG